MIDFDGATALVTGAASGIGKALARALAARGAFVWLADIDEAGVRAAAQELGARAGLTVCDLAAPESAARLIAEAWDWRGRLDLVCSNAGLGRNRKLLKEALDQEVERLFAVNLFAALRLVQAYAGRLETAAARGRVLVTASENSLSAPSAVKGRGLGLYGASKHGVLIMTEWLRDELKDGCLDLHVLLPGAVYTPMIARALPDPARAPPDLGLIMPERCAELALRGMDLGLFYIPTHAHIGDDMRPRCEGVAAALDALGLCDAVR